MTADDPLDQIKADAAVYKRAKANLDKAQAALVTSVVAGLRAGKRPADVARASEWDREYNRRLKAKADREDALALGILPQIYDDLSEKRIAQLDDWLREKRADWYADLETAVLAEQPESMRAAIAVSRGVNDGHIPQDSLFG